MEQGLGSKDALRRLGPVELTLARQGEGGGGGLLLVERHLPSQTRETHRGEESGLFFLNVGQRLIGFLEFDGLLLTLLVEKSKVLNHSIAISVFEAEQRRIEHGVSLTI